MFCAKRKVFTTCEKSLSHSITPCKMNATRVRQACNKHEVSFFAHPSGKRVAEREDLIAAINPVVEVMRSLKSLTARYGVSRATIYRWRSRHGQITRRQGTRKSLPPIEWKQLDRFYVLTSDQPWGFSWDRRLYEEAFLDQDEFDEDGNPLDYFQKVDRWCLGVCGKTFDQYIEEQEKEWQLFGRCDRSCN